MRAEAGRAKADGKLIPVKAPELTYADIPLPFGEMHTENVTSTDLIRAAVVAQLAKPAIMPSRWWLLTRTIRLQILTWAGIVGGSISVFTGLRSVVSLADWARWVVDHWHEWTRAFWGAILGWLGISIGPEFVPLLTFAVFVAMVAVGTALRASAQVASKEDASKTSTDKIRRFAIWAGLYVVWLSMLYIIQPEVTQEEVATRTLTTPHLIVTLVLMISAVVVPIAALIYKSLDRLQCLGTVFLFLFFWFVVELLPFMIVDYGAHHGQAATEERGFIQMIMWVTPPISLVALVIFVPLGALNKRLLFLVLGMLTLFALNKISTLGLGHYL